MTRFPKRVLYGLTAALVVATVATARADAPAQEAKRPSETQFLLFAFENLLNDAWPDVHGVVETERVRAFVAQRERLVHDLVDHVKEISLGDKQRNKDLVEMLELYMKSLHEHGDKLATELDACGEALRKKQIEILLAVDREAGAKKLEAASHVMATADFMSRSTDDPLTAVFATALVSLSEDARVKREIVNEARSRYLKYLADKKDGGGGGLAEYITKSRATADGAQSALRADLAERKETAKKLALELAAQHNWPEAETPFAAAADAERMTDLITQGLRLDAEPVETSKGDSAEADSRLKRAATFAKLAELIPVSRNKANNYYRADFYYRAGLEANRAAALTVDTDGFSAAKICPAAHASIKYWSQYKNNSDRDLTGETLHNYCLALSYNRQTIAAFDALKVDSKFFPSQPEFFYDQARMCSVAAEEYAVEIAMHPGKTSIEQGRQQQRLRLMFQESSLSLDRAVFFGFKDFERAKNVRDLKALREAEKSVVAPRRTFEQIVAEP
ncbi:MAG TPA: hypothetical protein VMS17_28605 [Gemmataceae bacterium]|nr:hypothetical protein [Gemmataceae bacterium]